MTIEASQAAGPNRAGPKVLFVEGHITPSGAHSGPVEIRRGMSVRSRDGQAAGQVAAAVIDVDSQAVTHVLLCRWLEVPDYRLVPVGLVANVEAGIVALDISAAEVETMPVREPV